MIILSKAFDSFFTWLVWRIFSTLENQSKENWSRGSRSEECGAGPDGRCPRA
jgi:hypothetical protein